MCLYPRLMTNKKYYPNKKNNYTPPIAKDYRTTQVPIPCGQCLECRKQKASEWRIRLGEHIKTHANGIFVTLTFDDEHLDKLCEEVGKKDCNEVATLAVRRFLERWRKKHKKSIEHWLITELGHQGTNRLHLHGLLFTDHPSDIAPIWRNGFVFLGTWVNMQTINYIVKYVTKIDSDHKGFVGQIYTSAGMGRDYMHRANQNAYRPLKTKDYYVLNNGFKVTMPTYYRNKIYSEDEREALWIEKLDQERRFILGQEYDTSTEAGFHEWEQGLKWGQQYSKSLGYGDYTDVWKKRDYYAKLRKMNANRKSVK